LDAMGRGPGHMSMIKMLMILHSAMSWSANTRQ